MNSSNAVKPQQPSPEEVAPSHPLMEGCQIHFYGPKAEGVSVWERVWQFRNRLKRFGKRRLHWLMFFLRGGSVPVEEAAPPQARVHSRPLQPGDRVRIRSRAAIEHSVNQWNELKGCGFMEEMWPYCGTEQVVFKRVERFMDEATYTMRKSRGLILLKDMYCKGTVDFGRCDRSCFFFWREEWLELIESDGVPGV